MDGTCLLLCEGGYRQAMVGTISLYDSGGERQHTTCVAASPESGRATFLARMQREVEQVKRLYPTAQYQGLADGAAENWTFLEPLTQTQVLDFYHATQYLDKVAKAVHPRSVEAQKLWMKEQCHRLKHEVGAAVRLLSEMEAMSLPKRLSATIRDGRQDAITYFRNHHVSSHPVTSVGWSPLALVGSPAFLLSKLFCNRFRFMARRERYVSSHECCHSMHGRLLYPSIDRLSIKSLEPIF